MTTILSTKSKKKVTVAVREEDIVFFLVNFSGASKAPRMLTRIHVVLYGMRFSVAL